LHAPTDEDEHSLIVTTRRGKKDPPIPLKWQRGTAMPTLDNLVVLAAVFGTTLDAIIVRSGASTAQMSA